MASVSLRGCPRRRGLTLGGGEPSSTAGLSNGRRSAAPVRALIRSSSSPPRAGASAPPIGPQPSSAACRTRTRSFGAMCFAVSGVSGGSVGAFRLAGSARRAGWQAAGLLSLEIDAGSPARGPGRLCRRRAALCSVMIFSHRPSRPCSSPILSSTTCRPGGASPCLTASLIWSNAWEAGLGGWPGEGGLEDRIDGRGSQALLSSQDFLSLWSNDGTPSSSRRCC